MMVVLCKGIRDPASSYLDFLPSLEHCPPYKSQRGFTTNSALGKKESVGQAALPAKCTDYLCSHPIGQNLVTGPSPTAKEAGK